jgi:beta-aspartyl-peptidase (threonine type)
LEEDQIEASKSGCRRAVLAGWQILRQGGSAVQAVERAICELEDDPAFDAGRGSFLNADGRLEMDAAIMNGDDLSTGAVAAVQNVAHPITLARRVLESDWAFIVGEGASRLAREHKMEVPDQWDLVTPLEFERWSKQRGDVVRYFDDGRFYRRVPPANCGTVGAVALDAAGCIVAGTSTGGSPNKPFGRVGDSALIGCGTYADSSLGGASLTGTGEMIIRVVLAKYAVDMLTERLGAQEAADRAIRHLQDRVGGVGGIILIDRWGRVGRAHSTTLMSSAYVTEANSEPVVEI